LATGITQEHVRFKCNSTSFTIVNPMMGKEEKPTAAFILTLIAGIADLMIMFFIYAVLQAIGGISSGLAIIPFTLLFLVFGLPLLSAIAKITLACGLYAKPAGHKRYGVLIIVFSFLSCLAGFIGFILGIVGGALAIAWKPTQVSRPPPQFPSRQTVTCSRCGYVNRAEHDFCGHCGSRLREEETQIY